MSFTDTTERGENVPVEDERTVAAPADGNTKTEHQSSAMAGTTGLLGTRPGRTSTAADADETLTSDGPEEAARAQQAIVPPRPTPGTDGGCVDAGEA
jgi:hypothetical protein